MSAKSDVDIFLQEQAPALLLRLDICRRILHLLREEKDAGKPEPSMVIALSGVAQITAPTAQPFYVPAVLSALIDIRKMCCFFGYSVGDAQGKLANYKKRKDDFDIIDLGIAQPSKSEFLGVLKAENVSEDEFEKALVAAVTYANKALAHYKIGRLRDTVFENHIMLSMFGIDRAVRILIFQRKGLPEPVMPINVHLES